MHVLERDAGVSGAEFGLFHRDADGPVGGVGLAEVCHFGPEYFLVFAVAGVQHCHHVAGHTNVAGGVAAVGGDGHFKGVVLFQMEVILGGHSDGGVVGQHHDAGMVGAQL